MALRLAMRTVTLPSFSRAGGRLQAEKPGFNFPPACVSLLFQSRREAVIWRTLGQSSTQGASSHLVVSRRWLVDRCAPSPTRSGQQGTFRHVAGKLPSFTRGLWLRDNRAETQQFLVLAMYHTIRRGLIPAGSPWARGKKCSPLGQSRWLCSTCFAVEPHPMCMSAPYVTASAAFLTVQRPPPSVREGGRLSTVRQALKTVKPV